MSRKSHRRSHRKSHRKSRRSCKSADKRKSIVVKGHKRKGSKKRVKCHSRRKPKH
jgi:hypothetical protein